MPRRLKEKVTAGMMLGMTLLGPAGAESQTKNQQLKQETSISESSKWKWPGAHWSFFTRGNDGQSHFNPWGLVFPGQLEFGKETTEEGKVRFEIPYEYSRLFDTGKPLDAADHEKLAEYIDQKLREEFADKIYGFDDDVYKTHHQNGAAENLKITGIAITGSASPEGHASKGPSTLEQGKADDENLTLALKRAETAMGLTEDSLKKLGITVEQLEGAAKAMGGKEIQFTDEEMGELTTLAAGEDGADPLEKIFNLTVKYNDGAIEDPQALAALNKIIGSKRKVAVTVSYEGNKDTTVLIPIPWIIFLPLLRRRSGGAPGEITPTGPVKERLQLPGLVVPPKFKEVNLPEQDSEEYKDMEERASIDDTYVHFDNPDTIRRGLDYHAMVDNLYFQYDEFKNDAEREEFLAAKILQGWKDHDRAARKEAGVSEEELDKGLDYENQDSQIKWAKMHAKTLFKLVKQKKEFEAQGKEYTYMELMTPEVVRLLKRRTGESELGAPAEPDVEEAVEAKENWAERKAGYLEALRTKKDALKAFMAMNAARAGKKLSELSADAREKYEELKKAWLEKREKAFEASEELPVDDRDRLADAASVADIDLRLGEELSDEEDIAGQTEIRRAEPETPVSAELEPENQERQKAAQTGAEVARLEETLQDTDRQLSEKHASLEEIERRIQFAKDTGRVPGIGPEGLAYWEEEKKRVLAETEQLEWERDAVAPRLERLQQPAAPGWAQKIRESFAAREKAPEGESPNASKKWSVWGWLKERGKGFLSLGVWEVRQGIRFQKGTKETAKTAAALANEIMQERDLDIEDAQDEANEIMAAMREQKIETVTAVEFWKVANDISEKKRVENINKIESITAGAIGQLKEKVAKYRGQATAESVLTPDRLKDVELALKRELAKMTRNAEAADARNLAKLMRENMDKYWWLRYIYGPLEASILGYVGYKFIPWSRVFGSAEDIVFSGGSDVELAGGDERMMDKNLWAESKELLQEQGIDNPTNAEIQQVDTALAQENNVRVVNPTTGETLWQETAGGQTSDRGMLKGLIKSAAGNKVALAIKAARIAAGAL